MKAEEAKTKTNNTSDEQKAIAEKKKAEEEKRLEEQMTKGAVMFIKGLTKETVMEEVKAFFGDYGKVAWVEYAKGDEKALVRFHAGNGKIVLNNADLETRVLDGEEEKDYWRKMFRDIADQRQKKKNKQFQNRKRRFGGRSNKQGNRNNDGESAKKARKVSDAE